MDDALQAVFGDEDAWYVGGAVRDELLGRPVLDIDVVCRDPAQSARAYASLSGGAPFALSEAHSSWRVVLRGGRTVDFTPVHGSIESDLARRDFTVNAIARPVAGGPDVDPSGGREDLQLRLLRAVSESIFEDDPLRLLRAVRLEQELGFTLAPLTEQLVRENAPNVKEAAGERILAELTRLNADGYRRLDELGLLAPLGGALDEKLDRFDSPRYRLVAVFGERLRAFPISRELGRYASTLLRVEPPPDRSARAIHRFRRETEPWARAALAFVGAQEYAPELEAARSFEHEPPLVRGDELGIAPGPEVGRILALIDEERAAGTISTRDEALELVRREVRR